MTAKKLDSAIAEILKQHGFGPEACWDCHGVWVVYHRVLEQIAAQASITFAAPLVLEANGVAKTAALCVTGTLSDKTEWSIGEAAPGNNKTAYPFAMAEKRAKDRVILKLIGLHGLAYSEEEADDFKTDSAGTISSDQITSLQTEMKNVNANGEAFLGFFKIKNIWELPTARFDEAMAMLAKKRAKAA